MLGLSASVTITTRLANGFSFFPKVWSIDAYRYFAGQFGTIGRAYIMMIIVTGIGTFLSIMVTSLFAYGLSNDAVPGTKIVNFLVVFTMLFNGGLAATYWRILRVKKLLTEVAISAKIFRKKRCYCEATVRLG